MMLAAVTVPLDVPGVSRTGMPIELVSPVRRTVVPDEEPPDVAAAIAPIDAPTTAIAATVLSSQVR
jgi:hypothetical protein